eukprot:170109-Pleurochrysis_carterae.AAC.2
MDATTLPTGFWPVQNAVLDLSNQMSVSNSLPASHQKLLVAERASQDATSTRIRATAARCEAVSVAIKVLNSNVSSGFLIICY